MGFWTPIHVYLYDGSFQGFLTAVFEAWHYPAESFGNIQAEQEAMYAFTDKNIPVETDPVKADRLCVWIQGKLPPKTGERIYEYFLAEEEGRERRIYFYLRACHRLGKWVDSYLTDPAVSDFLKAEKRIGNERHRMYEFTRFQLLEDNVLLAEIETCYNQLYSLGRFFIDRLPGQRFIIYDSGRTKAVLSNGKELAFFEDFQVDSVRRSREEDCFAALWKGYLQAMTIEERKNPKLQRQMLPLKYRKYMTEFQ